MYGIGALEKSIFDFQTVKFATSSLLSTYSILILGLHLNERSERKKKRNNYFLLILHEKSNDDDIMIVSLFQKNLLLVV